MENLPPGAGIYVVLFFLCVCSSAFFSGAETAITSLGSLKARHLLDTHGDKVKQINLWLKFPGRVLTTILVFNTAINIFASALATDLAHRMFGDQAVAIATGVTTFFILVFGEVIPKTYCKIHAEQLALPALKGIQVIYRLSYPVVWFLSVFTERLILLLGGQKKHSPPITEEELEYLVNVGEKAGVFEETKKDMISGVFEFDETRVREVMTPRPDIVAIDMNQSGGDALKIVVESGHSRLPVYEGRIDNIVGVVIAKDLLETSLDPAKLAQIKISSLMRKPYQVPESKFIVDVFKELKKTKNHMAIVIDEYGGTAGVVTLEDIIEEIVGEIQDEHDEEEAKVVEVEPGVFNVSGLMNRDEFLEYFDVEHEEIHGDGSQEADTIGGYLIQLLGDFPRVGQTVRIGPLKVEIVTVRRHRIERIRVARVLAEASDNTPG